MKKIKNIIIFVIIAIIMLLLMILYIKFMDIKKEEDLDIQGDVGEKVNFETNELKDVIDQIKFYTVSNCVQQYIDNLNTTYEKVKNIINNENIDEEKLDKIVDFINYYEKNKLDTILNTNKLWHQYFTDKEIITDAFQIISLYYMDAINYSCGHKINIFDKYENNIKEIANRNNVNQLIDKINIVLELKDLIKYNINISLLMDKLILRLEEV